MAANNLAPAIFGLDIKGNPLNYTELLRYVTPFAYKLKVNTSSDSTGVLNSAPITLALMPVVPCSQVLSNATAAQFYKFHEETNELFKMYASSSALCLELNPNEFSVVGGGTDKLQESFQLEMHPCSLPLGCASALELSLVRFMTTQPAYTTDLSNKKEPVTSYLSSGRYLQLTEQIVQVFTYRVGSTEVFDDQGAPFGKETIKAYNSIADVQTGSVIRNGGTTTTTLAQIIGRTSQAYAIFSFYSSGVQTKITRTYKSIVQTLSLIGGINSFVFIIFYYATALYTKYAKSDLLVGFVYPFLKTEKVFEELMESNNKNLKVKQKSTPETYKEIKKVASSQLEQSLDWAHLCSELNTLKVITEMLLDQHQQQIVSLAAVAIQARLDAEQAKHYPVDKNTKVDVSAVKELQLLQALERMRNVRAVLNQVQDGETLTANEQTSSFLVQQLETKQSPFQKLLENQADNDFKFVTESRQSKSKVKIAEAGMYANEQVVNAVRGGKEHVEYTDSSNMQYGQFGDVLNDQYSDAQYVAPQPNYYDEDQLEDIAGSDYQSRDQRNGGGGNYAASRLDGTELIVLKPHFAQSQLQQQSGFRYQPAPVATKQAARRLPSQITPVVRRSVVRRDPESQFFPGLPELPTTLKNIVFTSKPPARSPSKEQSRENFDESREVLEVPNTNSDPSLAFLAIYDIARGKHQSSSQVLSPGS